MEATELPIRAICFKCGAYPIVNGVCLHCGHEHDDFEMSHPDE